MTLCESGDWMTTPRLFHYTTIIIAITIAVTITIIVICHVTQRQIQS